MHLFIFLADFCCYHLHYWFHMIGDLLPARHSFPVTTNSLPWVRTLTLLTKLHCSFPPSPCRLSEPHTTEVASVTQTCHDGRQINTWMLKPIWETRLCGWQSAGDGSGDGKYEVCVLTGGEMTKAKMMSGCYYCWHSTFFHRQDILLRSPAGSSSHRARRHKLLRLSKTCLIRPEPALA